MIGILHGHPEWIAQADFKWCLNNKYLFENLFFFFFFKLKKSTYAAIYCTL